MRTSKLGLVLSIAAFGAAMSFGAIARADGVATKASELPTDARASLLKEISAFRAAHPEAFTAARGVNSHRPEVYKSQRNPIPSTDREFRALGAAGLLPMLEELAFDAPDRGDLSDREWTALATGMLEAVGVLRDPRSAPVLQAIFDGSSDPKVVAAAARAMGRLGGDVQLAALIQATQASDGRRFAAIGGLGECKRLESAKHLASLLPGADDASADVIAGALGNVGASWAWKAMGPSAAATGLEVRGVVARALMPGFLRSRGELRTRMRKGLLMVEHPVTLDLIANARAGADADTTAALDQLKTRLDKQLAR
jgi:hypothetical protein